jgi:hypothetical protein
MVVESAPLSELPYGVAIGVFLADGIPSHTPQLTSALTFVFVLPCVSELMRQYIYQALHPVQEQPWLVSSLHPLLKRYVPVWVEAVVCVGSCYY